MEKEESSIVDKWTSSDDGSYEDFFELWDYCVWGSLSVVSVLVLSVTKK